MKIAVTSTGPTLDDQIDPRFGRCAYFVIVETKDMSFEAFDNESIALGGGAGIQSAQFVASKGIVREVVERYKKEDIKSTNTPNVSDHFGMGSGSDMDRWMRKGCGGGKGMGRGMGMGRGVNRSTWNISDQSGAAMLSKEEKLNRLKDQANELRQQIEDLESSMKTLEEK